MRALSLLLLAGGAAGVCIPNDEKGTETLKGKVCKSDCTTGCDYCCSGACCSKHLGGGATTRAMPTGMAITRLVMEPVQPAPETLGCPIGMCSGVYTCDGKTVYGTTCKTKDENGCCAECNDPCEAEPSKPEIGLLGGIPVDPRVPMEPMSSCPVGMCSGVYTCNGETVYGNSCKTYDEKGCCSECNDPCEAEAIKTTEPVAEAVITTEPEKLPEKLPGCVPCPARSRRLLFASMPHSKPHSNCCPVDFSELPPQFGPGY